VLVVVVVEVMLMIVLTIFGECFQSIGGKHNAESPDIHKTNPALFYRQSCSSCISSVARQTFKTRNNFMNAFTAGCKPNVSLSSSSARKASTSFERDFEDGGENPEEADSEAAAAAAATDCAVEAYSCCCGVCPKAPPA
jgi:hypothetical protein